MSPETNELYEFGPFQLDTLRRRLLRAGEPVAVTSKALDTLVVLIRNRTRVMEKDELLKAIWPDSFVEEANLAQNISTLRKALGDQPGQNRYITTVPGRGYRFVGEVRAPVATPAVVVDTRTTAEVVIEEEVEDGRKSRAWLVVAVAVVICAAVTVYLMKREPAADPSRPRTLAVLPFRQLSPSPSDQYLGVGLTDAVITRLSNLRQLVVRPTGTVLKYTAPADLRGPGHELGVEAVLDGSLQKSGDRLRLTVQLVRVDDGRPLWAETFDEQLTSLFALEDSVSEKVAHALSIRLGGEERQMLARHDTENVEAYRNYLQGRVAEFRFTREGMNEAIGDFNRAIGLDPKYALAYAGLADAYATASDWVLAPRQAMPKAEAAARQALAIDDRLAEAHGALAHALMHQWHLKEANTEFERALALNPNQTAFYFAYGEYLTAISEDARAVAELRAGLRLDPLSADILAMIGWPLYLKGDYQGGLAACQEAERIYPDYWLAYMGAGFDLLALRRNEEAVAAFEKARTLNPESTINLSGLAAAWAAEGLRAKVADLLAAMNKMSAQQYVSPMDLALVHLVLGERDAALASLEKAYDDQSEMMLFLKRYPLFEPLRGEARFQALVRRVTSD